MSELLCQFLQRWLLKTARELLRLIASVQILAMEARSLSDRRPVLLSSILLWEEEIILEHWGYSWGHSKVWQRNAKRTVWVIA